MRFIILFLFFSITAVSQNYHYSLDQQQAVEADVIVPTAPINFVVSDITESSASLTWTASTDNVGVTNYRIYQNNVFLITTGNVTSFTLSNINTNILYQFTLRAMDAAGNESDNSNALEQPISKGSIPVVVILGQSNGDGAAFNVDFSTDINTFYSTDHPNLKIYYKPAIRNHDTGNVGIEPSSLVDDGEWWTLTNGHDAANKKTLQSIGMPNSTVAYESTQTHGAEAAMSKWWEENYAGQELRIIKFGIGATSLQDDWLGTGNLYDNFMQYVYNPAIADIIAEGNTPDLIGVYWNQGESDNNDSMAPNYESNLETLISNFRTDSGIADARFIVAQLSDYLNTTNWNTIKTAEANVAANDANVDLIVTDGTGDLAVIEKNPNDLIHYTSAGQTQLAEAFWGVIYPKSTVSNFIAEIKYFNAVLVPVTAKDSLQWYLDTYNHIRLEDGNYGRVSGTTINIGSNQSIYGHPNYTEFPNINILAGSSYVHLENLYDYQITFQSGAPITNSVFKNIKYATVQSVGGMIEDNLFINLNSSLNLDLSGGGYYRNNRIYRHTVHNNVALNLKGNSATPSYGNVHVWSNYLTPQGEGVIMDNMGDMNFIGVDSEGWNIKALGDKAMFVATNMGKLKLGDAAAGASYNAIKIPGAYIEAESLYLFKYVIGNQGASKLSQFIGDTNVFAVSPDDTVYEVADGYDFKAHPKSSASLDDTSMYYDSVLTNTLITDTTIKDNLRSQILDTEHTPIPRPTFETIPDPLGVNWATERIGKLDSRDYIQNLIDTNTIAELPEGVYYIGSSLNLDSTYGNQQGLIGQGTGKTVICGLTDDFPLILITNDDWSQANNTIANFTLQGGSSGIKLDESVRLSGFNVWKHIVFRNQTVAGLHFRWLFGFDNNMIENFCFVDCAKGIFNDYKPNDGTEEWKDNWLGYIDKTMFYKCQFINCGQGIDMLSARAHNLDYFVDCNFDNNDYAVDLAGNSMGFINCDFTNNRGVEVMRSNGINVYNCNFNNNSAVYSINAQAAYIEGCTLSDNVPLFSGTRHGELRLYVQNSTIDGTLGSGSLGIDYGVFINNDFAQVPTLNKLLVNMKGGVKTTIIDEASNPYPQFFVKY